MILSHPSWVRGHNNSGQDDREEKSFFPVVHQTTWGQCVLSHKYHQFRRQQAYKEHWQQFIGREPLFIPELPCTIDSSREIVPGAQRARGAPGGDWACSLPTKNQRKKCLLVRAWRLKWIRLRKSTRRHSVRKSRSLLCLRKKRVESLPRLHLPRGSSSRSLRPPPCWQPAVLLPLLFPSPLSWKNRP
jgi:hypothetical protein